MKRNVDLLFAVPGSFSQCPYLQIYIDFVIKKGLSWKAIVWERADDTYNPYPDNIIEYQAKLDNKSNRLLKALYYISYVLFICRKICVLRPMVLLLFSIELSFFLFPFLFLFRKKYILDIRDRSVINDYLPFSVYLAIKHSKTAFISSQKFREWLPNSFEYFYSPNISLHCFNNSLTEIPNKFIARPFRILFLGQVRYFDYTFEFLKSLDRSKFIVDFRGYFLSDSEKFKGLSHFFSNVNYLGRYKKEEEISIASQYDFIAIILPGKSANNMTNRFYTALSSGVPMIVNEDSITSFYLSDSSLGVVVPKDFSDLSNRLMNYINNFHLESFVSDRRRLLKQIENEIIQFESILDSSLQSLL